MTPLSFFTPLVVFLIAFAQGRHQQFPCSSFSEKNIRGMIQFHEVFPDEPIAASILRQLSRAHFIALIPLKDPLQGEFYAEMCRHEKYSFQQ
jgi:hypothetical protein